MAARSCVGPFRLRRLPSNSEHTMKYLLTLLLGIGTVSAVACRSSSNEMSGMRNATVELAVSGMT